MIVKTADEATIRPFLEKLYVPPKISHKDQNGKVLVIGGSNLFHSASIWAAEVASHFADMVFYSSVDENNQILHETKKKFHNGIVVKRIDIEHYINEADSILIGPGMVRKEGQGPRTKGKNLEDILNFEDEGDTTYYLTKYILEKYPKKRFVLDAGALQMMEPAWLLGLKTLPILTPHKGEFTGLFGEGADPAASAKKYHSVIVLKTIQDIVTDGTKKITVEGGNQGLTKGGTGDILAGLVTALYAKSDPITASVVASYLLKKSADSLYLTKGYWYNIDDIIEEIPKVLKRLTIV